jgi:hypothetical protein
MYITTGRLSGCRLRAQSFEIVGGGSRPPWRVLRCIDEMIE